MNLVCEVAGLFNGTGMDACRCAFLPAVDGSSSSRSSTTVVDRHRNADAVGPLRAHSNTCPLSQHMPPTQPASRPTPPPPVTCTFQERAKSNGQSTRLGGGQQGVRKKADADIAATAGLLLEFSAGFDGRRRHAPPAENGLAEGGPSRQGRHDGTAEVVCCGEAGDLVVTGEHRTAVQQ